MDYADFLESKRIIVSPSGINIPLEKINSQLFDFQRDITRWSLRKGKAAVFGGTGTGKTPIQLEWSNHIPGDVLILAPLAVSQQTVREGRKFGIKVNPCRHQNDMKSGINITNYEMLQHFDPKAFIGVVLDESSLLKSHDAKYRSMIIESFRHTPYKLACTATPSPNDYMELGNHAEFLGVMSYTEMLSTFFVHDGGETSKWRLKGHAKEAFWKWVASWAVMFQKPSDLGYDDDGFILPPLNIHQITVTAPILTHGDALFQMEGVTLQERQQARRNTINERVRECAKLINISNEPWVIWCGLNSESEALTKAIEGAVEIRGSHSSEYKERTIIDFIDGKIQKIVTKPEMFGFGLNLQHCCKTAFVGLSDSFEQYYQAIRRFYRFGQKKPVNAYIIVSDTEGAVVRNIKRKERDFEDMLSGMISATQEISRENIRGTERESDSYSPIVDMKLPDWLVSKK